MEIDLNADLGEGGDHDNALLALVSSANISCGAHAGSEADIRAALQTAKQYGVRIGAHPSYPDRDNMGRKVMAMPVKQLQKSLRAQLTHLHNLASDASVVIRFVKPHGALYNQAARDLTLATHVVSAIKAFDSSLTLVGLAGSQLLRAGRDAGLSTCAEAFVDRAYQTDGSLLPRSHAGAVLVDTELAVQQALHIITRQCVQTHDGQTIPMRADTLCIHGDTPQALSFAKALHQRLGEAGIRIRACP
ncbi:MAG: hypothetical protein CMQ34_13720 [Gammaproteobacteria bacterium]|nr:hypothetical protein [Gammaproteobacteria bacterium]